jgi:hypothetical protein
MKMIRCLPGGPFTQDRNLGATTLTIPGRPAAPSPGNGIALNQPTLQNGLDVGQVTLDASVGWIYTGSLDDVTQCPPAFPSGNGIYRSNAGTQPDPAALASGANICVQKLANSNTFASNVSIIVPKLKQLVPASIAETGVEDLSMFEASVSGGSHGDYSLVSATPDVCEPASTSPTAGDVQIKKLGLGECKLELTRLGDAKHIATAPVEIVHSIDRLVFTDLNTGIAAQCVGETNLCFVGHSIDAMVVDKLLDDTDEFNALSAELEGQELTDLFEIHFEDNAGVKVPVSGAVQVLMPGVLDGDSTHKVWHKHCSSTCAAYSDYDAKVEIGFTADASDAKIITDKFSYFGVSRPEAPANLTPTLEEATPLAKTGSDVTRITLVVLLALSTGYILRRRTL